MPSKVERTDPFPAFKFRIAIEINGVIEGGFTECKGLNAKWKTFKYKEGGVNDYIHQLPERVQYSKIKLKRGMDFSRALWDWFQQGVRDGKVDRKNISIILFNAAGEEVKRWNLTGAYPIAWKGPALKVPSKKIAIETLEIIHHGMTLAEAPRRDD